MNKKMKTLSYGAVIVAVLLILVYVFDPGFYSIQFNNFGTTQAVIISTYNVSSKSNFPTTIVIQAIPQYANGTVIQGFIANTSCITNQPYSTSYAQYFSGNGGALTYLSLVNGYNSSQANSTATCVLNLPGVPGYAFRANLYFYQQLSNQTVLLGTTQEVTGGGQMLNALIILPVSKGSVTVTMPPPPPPPTLQAQILALFQNFYSYLKTILYTYFGLNSFALVGLKSIAITNITASNVTTLGRTVVGTVSLTIPSANLSNAWTPSTTKLIRTYCQALVKNMNTSAILYNSTLVNMSSTTTFTWVQPVNTAKAGPNNYPGVLVFGGICQTTTDTYSSGKWLGWTAYANDTSQRFAIYVGAQQQLTTSASPTAGGVVTPASGKFNYSSSVTLTETPQAGYNFTGWVGTGKNSYTGTNPEPTILMNNTISETAMFQTATTNPGSPPQPNLLQELTTFLSQLFSGQFCISPGFCI